MYAVLKKRELEKLAREYVLDCNIIRWKKGDLIIEVNLSDFETLHLPSHLNLKDNICLRYKREIKKQIRRYILSPTLLDQEIKHEVILQ